VSGPPRTTQRPDCPVLRLIDPTTGRPSDDTLDLSKTPSEGSPPDAITETLDATELGVDLKAIFL
jgi:hypothetical protein